ncbi:hypothetical protein ACKAV7_014589 [Fusarium commune]
MFGMLLRISNIFYHMDAQKQFSFKISQDKGNMQYFATVCIGGLSDTIKLYYSNVNLDRPPLATVETADWSGSRYRLAWQNGQNEELCSPDLRSMQFVTAGGRFEWKEANSQEVRRFLGCQRRAVSEKMEPATPLMNDETETLSRMTPVEAFLATPASSVRSETLQDPEHQYLWRCFPDHVWSQRVRDTSSWVWDFGYDIQNLNGSRRWVCKRCIQNKSPRPRSFAEKGIQNANAHLFKGHGIWAPAEATKSAAQKKAEKMKTKDQRSIADVMKLDTRLPREQEIANSLVKSFDRKHFQRLLLEWIIEENHSFSICEQGRLRQIFEYLNPLVKITDASITRKTIRHRILSAYESHKGKVIAALKQSSGLIHVSFDGWKSGNRHSLYGIACFFRDENSQPRKLVLGVPELRTRHFGHNIAAEILDVLDAYGIQDRIGYFTLDNAESNDKAMEVIGGKLGFVGSTRRGRCFGHTLNLSAKALLFGHNVEAFEEQLSGAAALSEAEHALWRRKGPVGKLHNLVVEVRRSDQLTYLLRSIQRSEFDMSSDPRIKARKPLDLIIDNDTRKSAKEPQICLEENQLRTNDWDVLDHLAKLLGFYEDGVKTLEGDGQQRRRKRGWVGSYGNVWEVIQGFEFLLEVLEDYRKLASKIPDAEHFRININLGWEKLNKYYSRLDETPIYYTALVLHPAFRWGYFENEWKDNAEWVKKAKQMVREVWEGNIVTCRLYETPWPTNQLPSDSGSTTTRFRRIVSALDRSLGAVW